jgi:hypothetical protein
MSEPAKPRLDVYKSYLAAIEGSVGTSAYRKMYFVINGEPLDVLEDGDLSCAVFVTSILYLFDLITERHTTVNSTIEDARASGWYEIKEPKGGALILWGFKKKDGGTQGKHRHVGFYLDAENAVSNDSDTRIVTRHHPTFGTFPSGEARRDIVAYYWHDALGASR